MSDTQRPVEFRWEWEPAPDVRAPEHRVTWARLEIWVAGECVTWVEDRSSGSSRRSIYCSMYPIAEWIAYTWWLLRADTRPSEFIRTGAVWTHAGSVRHNLRASGDGFEWPDLIFVPQGDTSRVMWRKTSPVATDASVRYISQGDTTVDSGALELELARVVETVIGRLQEEDVRGTAVEDEWTEVRNTDPATEEFCLAAARLGLDPYSAGGDHAEAIMEARQHLQASTLTDFLDAVSVENISPVIGWIDNAERFLDGVGPVHLNGLAALQKRLQRDQSKGRAVADAPWLIGYREADHVREVEGLTPDKPFDVEDLITARKREESHDPRVQALGHTSTDFVAYGQSMRAPARRFISARALWHVLFNVDKSYLLTAAHTSRQRIARAFAAQLLAPAEGIERRLNGRSVAEPAELDSIAAHYKVSPILVQYQIENQLVGVGSELL